MTDREPEWKDCVSGFLKISPARGDEALWPQLNKVQRASEVVSLIREKMKEE